MPLNFLKRIRDLFYKKNPEDMVPTVSSDENDVEDETPEENVQEEEEAMKEEPTEEPSDKISDDGCRRFIVDGMLSDAGVESGKFCREAVMTMLYIDKDYHNYSDIVNAISGKVGTPNGVVSSSLINMAVHHDFNKTCAAEWIDKCANVDLSVAKSTIVGIYMWVASLK